MLTLVIVGLLGIIGRDFMLRELDSTGQIAWRQGFNEGVVYGRGQCRTPWQPIAAPGETT